MPPENQPSLDRRLIRQTAVQLLYSLHLEGIEQPCDYSTFWNLLQETDSFKLLTAQLRAVQHVTHDLEQRCERLQLAQRSMKSDFMVWRNKLAHSHNADETTLGSLQALTSLLAQSEQISEIVVHWSLKLHSLNALQANIDEHQQQRAQLEAAFKLNQELQRNLQPVLNFEQKLSNQATAIVEAFLAAARRLGSTAERLVCIAQPLDFPNNKEIVALRSNLQQMQFTRELADNMVDMLFGRLSEIDEILAQNIRDYRPENVSPVDRAILRLAIYDMAYCPEIPAAVIIKDSVILAQNLSSNKSDKFINGVLDDVKNKLR